MQAGRAVGIKLYITIPHFAVTLAEISRIFSLWSTEIIDSLKIERCTCIQGCCFCSLQICRILHNRCRDNVCRFLTGVHPLNAKVLCMLGMRYGFTVSVELPVLSPSCTHMHSDSPVYSYIGSVSFSPSLSCIPIHSFLLCSAVRGSWCIVPKKKALHQCCTEMG